MTVCHFVAFGTNHSHKGTTPHCIAFPEECRETCFEELFNSLLCVLPRGVMAQSEKDLEKALGEVFFFFFEGLLDVVRTSLRCSREAMPNYKI